MSRGIRVTAVDLETGEVAERTVQPGDYAIVAVAPCHLAAQQHDINGTAVLTLRGLSADLSITTVYVAPGGEGHDEPTDV